VTACAWRLVAIACATAVVAGCTVGRPSADVERALRARELMVPVAGVRPEEVPDTFHAARDGGMRRHQALDIPAARGTPVVAADAGTVLSVGASGAGGRTVYVSDPDGRFVYYYAHLDRHRSGLRKGMAIVRGQVLGHVGTTGNATPTAPHLHFQVSIRPTDGRWWNGWPIDPRPFLVVPGVVSE